MNTPKISVIVPVYNMKDSLRRALDSLVNQSYRDFEVIIIDDGSKDCSGKICDEYAAKYSNFSVCHKPNGGVSSARNKGMELARGEWITFCDSDDYALPCWLENYDLENAEDVQLIQQGAKCDKPQFIRNGEPALLCGFDYTGKPLDYLFMLDNAQMIGYTWMKAYKADVIKENGLLFNPKIRYKEDEIFLLQYLASISLVKSLNKQGYFYFVPDWKSKYRIPIIDKEIFIVKHSDAFLKFAIAHGFVIEMRKYSDSLIDELMTCFAHRPKVKHFNRIKNLLNISYEASALFKPLKWVIRNDKTTVVSYPALLVHSILRSILKK